MKLAITTAFIALTLTGCAYSPNHKVYAFSVPGMDQDWVQIDSACYAGTRLGGKCQLAADTK